MKKRNLTGNANQAKQTEPEVRMDQTNRENQKNPAKKMRKRKVLKTVGIAAGAAACAFVLYHGAAFAAAQIYWGNDDASISLNTEKYAQEAEDLQDEYDEQWDSLLSIVDQAEEISAETEKLFAEYNGYIETYFSEVYGIDVSGVIDEKEVKMLDFTLGQSENEMAGTTVNGMYDFTGDTLYISADYFADGEGIWEDEIREVYIHEMVHALGSVESEDDMMVYVYEGITEYLTGQIITYSGQTYLDFSSYTYNTELAEQIIEADDTLVTEMIGHYEEFSLTDWLDERTGGYAQELENMLFLVHFGGYTKEDILVRAQYITAQYCKSVNPNEAEEIVTDNPIVRDFALKSML